MSSDKPGVIAGFKDFLLRGNVVDLAVAVVVGAAFTAVVNAFATDFIGSLIALVGGVPNLDDVGIPVGDNTIVIGTVLTSLINFIIVAAVVYFLVVVPVTRLMARRSAGEEPEVVATPEDVALLQEIRDLLRDSARPARPGGPGGPGGQDRTP